MSCIVIEPLRPELQLGAAKVLARAFVTNPLHVAAFGAGALANNEAFFRIGLSVMRGPKFVAVSDGRILGVVTWVDSSGCQFSGVEKLRMTPAMISGFGPLCSAIIRVSDNSADLPFRCAPWHD